jgi:hypothetical protein
MNNILPENLLYDALFVLWSGPDKYPVSLQVFALALPQDASWTSVFVD